MNEGPAAVKGSCTDYPTPHIVHSVGLEEIQIGGYSYGGYSYGTMEGVYLQAFHYFCSIVANTQLTGREAVLLEF